jgi:5-methylcytosine-specific restriction endonuclease McrA
VSDPRQSRAWRKLRDQVIAEEPLCWLRFPGICTRVSTTADHVLTYTERPDLAMSRANLRGCCWPCNNARKNTPASSLNLEQPAALGFFGG